LNTSRKISYLFAFLLSFFMTTSAIASEKELCSAFENAEIDESLIAAMLRAAENDSFYRIKPNSSKMGFCVDGPLGMVTGNFQKFNGGLALEGSGSQTLVSIDTSSLKSDGLLVEGLLKSDEFFDVNNFPDILFVSSGFEWLSDTRAVLNGELSMRGITKPVAFYVEITEVGDELSDSGSILVKATTTVQRSEFGMDSLSSMVSDKVNLCMSVEAEKYREL
jgi:polyisoprenoid-binding protein YceI